jgi:hypothetical protein
MIITDDIEELAIMQHHFDGFEHERMPMPLKSARSISSPDSFYRSNIPMLQRSFKDRMTLTQGKNACNSAKYFEPLTNFSQWSPFAIGSRSDADIPFHDSFLCKYIRNIP